MRARIAGFALLLTFGFAVAGGSLTAAGAATITIVNLDGVGEGFNDATPAAPVGGNPGATIGAQRLYVFQYAANLWGGILPSNVEIKVQARFNPLSCTATSGVLGSAGPISVARNFANAPFPDTWYHVALGNKLAGVDLVPTMNDINTTFNSAIGGPTCLPAGWYYGVDGNEGTAIELLPVVLHELGHGLGFSTVTNGQTGAYFNGFPSIYDRFLLDLTQNMHWHEMTQAQRAASGVNCQKLVWDGPSTTAASDARLGPKPVLRVNSPPTIAGDYSVGLAQFGPALTSLGVTGDVVLANDGDAYPTNGCESFGNGGDLNGKIALIDRGTCPFVVKVKNAQDAGAIAVIVADTVAGCPPAGLGGADPTITIPSVRITQSDGALLKANLVAGVNATLILDPTLNAGSDPSNRVLMYSPVPYAGGSSISHWDTSAEPSLLMEPAITNGLSSDVDLTTNLFTDIGWFLGPVPVRIAAGSVVATSDHVRVEWFSQDAGERSWTAYRREADTEWMAIGSPSVTGDGLIVLDDTAVTPGRRYAYRIGAPGPEGEDLSEIVWADVPAAQLALALEGARPNPSAGRMTVAFTLASAAAAKLQVVDVAGRVVQSAEVGDRGPGRHVLTLGADGSLPSGTYFLRLTQEGQSMSRAVVVVQ